MGLLVRQPVFKGHPSFHLPVLGGAARRWRRWQRKKGSGPPLPIIDVKTTRELDAPT